MEGELLGNHIRFTLPLMAMIFLEAGIEAIQVESALRAYVILKADRDPCMSARIPGETYFAPFVGGGA